MRFTPVLLFGLAAAEVSMHKRQVAAINGIMSEINTQVGQLDQAIKGYTGGAGQEIISASDKILATTKKGLETVSGIQPVTLTDAVQIQGVVQTLTDTLKQTVDDLISKKGALVGAGQGGKTEQTLQSQYDGAAALAKAISGKVPPEVQSLAVTLSGGITEQIQRGIAAFKGTGGGAGAGAGSEGAAPPAPGASLSIGSSSADTGSTTVSGSAGASAGGASAGGAASGGMSSMGMGSSSSSVDTGAASQVSSPAVYTGAGASFKPASVFGLVAVVAVLAM